MKSKQVIAAVAAAAVVGVGAFGVVKLTEKDPKEEVIDAFKNVYSEDQTYPFEEIFGLSELRQNALETSTEGTLKLVLDRCSDETINPYAGSGFRLDQRSDVENKKSAVDLGVIYNNMDLLTAQFYYGDEKLMASVPDLIGKVFVLDLGDGLADRLKESPTVGPMLEYAAGSGEVDLEGELDYLKELREKFQTEKAGDPYDLKGLLNRYKEGCRAQENFKAAMTVEKAGRKICRMDGGQVNCKGYQVHISKDAMLAFVRTSSDFFLQDETLKQTYLENLERSTKIASFFGTSSVAVSAKDLQEETYEEVRAQVEEAIDQLDQMLQDVDMTIYVDKKGRLAAVDGATSIIPYAEEGESQDQTPVPLTFSAELQGGTYLTQNGWASVTIEEGGDVLMVKLTKTGSYADGRLECQYLVSAKDETEAAALDFGGSYTEDSGEYSFYVNAERAGTELGSIEISGVVDQLEKGVSMHVAVDEISVQAPEKSFELVLSGEYSIQPLGSEVTEPEGEQLDVLAATEDDWSAITMELWFSLIGLTTQFGNVQN